MNTVEFKEIFKILFLSKYVLLAQPNFLNSELMEFCCIHFRA